MESVPNTGAGASSSVPKRAGALARFARRTFDALTVDQARAVLTVRPDPVSSVRRSGRSPYRMLCFGSGALRGLGLRDHNLGLPGRIADRIVDQTGRGVQIDVIVDSAPTSAAALSFLTGLRLQRYDAIIVVLGDISAAPAQPDAWRGAVVGLAHLLVSATSDAAGLFVYDTSRAVATANLSSGATRSAGALARLTQVTEETCALTKRIRFSELRLTLGAQDASGQFSDGTYRDWADYVVERLKPVFVALEAATGDQSPRAYRNKPEDERFRQRALDSLRLHAPGRDDALDREVAAARSMYRTSGAALNLIDRDLQRARASTEAELPVMPRGEGMCSVAIGSDELTLINDTWLDARTRSSPLVQGDAPIRFYAGFPVHSIDGYRVGMVCIYGTTPRSLRRHELEGLRDVAARVEQHLWNDLFHARSA